MVNPKDIQWTPRSNEVYDSDKTIGRISCIFGSHIHKDVVSDCGRYRVYYCKYCHKVLGIYKEYAIHKPRFYVT
jgi:hypothetical protein